MATLTDEDLALLRRRVGSSPSDAELGTLFEQFGTVDEVAVHVLSIRHADLVAGPSSFTIPGDYAESRSDAQIAALSAAISTGGAGEARVTDPPAPRVR